MPDHFDVRNVSMKASRPVLLFLIFFAIAVPVWSQDALDRTILPIPEPQPPVITELDARNVKAPPLFKITAPKSAPNVVIVLLDDMGFGQSSAFGGPIHMPTLDMLAANGLRYNNFHTTALCSPTRNALLTGRNQHVANAGAVTELATSFPGNTGIRPLNVAPLAEMLRLNGYSTAAFGKYHETPAWEVSVSGPYDRWPTHSGFDKFYGFIGGETNQWAPALFDGTTRVEVPHDPNYHFTVDMTNQAIGWMQAQHALTPDKPFFVYFAPGAVHGPHHVFKEYIERYKGKFDQGWDQLNKETYARQKQMGVIPANADLTPRPKEIPSWDSQSPDEQKLEARQMETFAGFGEHTDEQIGRLVDTLNDMGVMDNTLFIYIVGDNGASAEGGPSGAYNEIMALNGILYNADAKETHTTQYFEMFGNRGIYHDGWIAATRHSIPWIQVRNPPLTEDVWELYHITEDFSEAHDLAAKDPVKLKEMQGIFIKEAIQNHVLPIDDRRSERFNPALAGRPDLMGDRTSLTVYPGMVGMMENTFINVKNRYYTVVAPVELRDGNTNGVIIAQGGRFGGWTLYMKDGKVHHEYNFFGIERTNIADASALSAGKHVIKYEFTPDAPRPGTGGKCMLFVDGKQVAQGHIPKTVPFIFSGDEGADVGLDAETAVSDDYKEGNNKFSGTIVKVTVDVSPSGLSAADQKAVADAEDAAMLDED